jgi:hypothetical protein
MRAAVDEMSKRLLKTTGLCTGSWISTEIELNRQEQIQRIFWHLIKAKESTVDALH